MGISIKMKWLLVLISLILITILWLPKSVGENIKKIFKTYNEIFSMEERWNKHIVSVKDTFESDFTYTLYSITMACCLFFYYLYYFIIYVIAVITGKEDSFFV